MEEASQKFLVTPVFTIRDCLKKDFDHLVKWHKPGHKWQDLDGPYYKSGEDDSEKMGQNFLKNLSRYQTETPRHRLAIVDSSTDSLIGFVVSYWESIETHWLCLGIVIFDDQYWGKKVGFESFRFWVDYQFKHRKELARLDLRTWSGNHGMIGLAKKLGFQQEACFRKARIVKGEYYDGLGFGILREEWEASGFQNA